MYNITQKRNAINVQQKITIQGNITETRYKWPERRKRRLEILGSTSASDGDVVAINDEKGLHRIQNDSDSEKAISLHFYYPPITNCLTKSAK